MERQIERAEKDNKQIDPHMDKPYGVPADFAEHFKLMSNMIAIAFQADLTRIVTFLVTREGSSRPYRELGIPDGHHPLTHHRNQPELMEKVRKINEYHVQQFAGFVEKMKSDQRRRRHAARQLHDRLRRRPFRSATRICTKICRPSSWAAAETISRPDAACWPATKLRCAICSSP